jgi:hypothetical protein
MPRAATIATVLILAAAFAWVVPIARLFAAFQPLIVALSIIVAALLVRLNRGMPTLDWKGLEPTGRGKLTTKIVELAREYAVIVAVSSILLVLLVSLTVVGEKQLTQTWLEVTQRVVAGVIGGLLGFSLSRMAYVVWRDYDVVKLQKTLIDNASAREEQDNQTLAAEDRISRIRAAGLRQVGAAGPKTWEED